MTVALFGSRSKVVSKCCNMDGGEAKGVLDPVVTRRKKPISREATTVDRCPPNSALEVAIVVTVIGEY